MAATIPRQAVDFLTEEINGISADAQARVLKVLRGIQWTPENVAECRDLVLQILAAVMPTYTTMAAQASADFYDAERTLALGEPFGATAVSGYDPARTDGAVRALVQRIVDGKPVQSFNDGVLERIDYEMKRAAGNSMLENGRADPKGPRFARVPTGSETCEFCIMLASRGFVYRSEKSAGALDHYHANCDCRIVASFDADTVEGYDPDDLYLRWKDPEAWEEKHRNASGRHSQPPSFSHTVEDVDLPSGRSGVSAGTSQCNIYETQDGKRFIFPVGMDTSKQDMTPERAIGLYERVPDNVKRHMQDTIFFVDYENPEDAHWRRVYKNFSKSYATGGDEITFYAYTGHDDDYVVRTFCHEAGHYIDSSNSKGGRSYSSRFDWQDAMANDYKQKGSSHPTQYASNSNSEDFAESVAEYSINGVQFRQDFPSRASLLDSLLT